MPRVDIAPSSRPSLAAVALATVAVLAVALVGLGAPAAHAATSGRGAGSSSSMSGGGSSRTPGSAVIPPGTQDNCVAGRACGPMVATMSVTGERKPREVVRPSGHGHCSTLYRADAT